MLNLDAKSTNIKNHFHISALDTYYYILHSGPNLFQNGLAKTDVEHVMITSTDHNSIYVEVANYYYVHFPP